MLVDSSDTGTDQSQSCANCTWMRRSPIDRVGGVLGGEVGGEVVVGGVVGVVGRVRMVRMNIMTIFVGVLKKKI